MAELPEFKWDQPLPGIPMPAMTMETASTGGTTVRPRRTRLFHSRDSLRQVIVGAEVLGKPVALR